MWVSTAVHITALLVLVVIIVQAQTGPDDVDMTTLENINVSFHGEGMVYAPFLDRFIFGSLQYGTLLSVPRASLSNESSPPTYGADEVTYILRERPTSFAGSNFLGLEMDPHHADIVWACVSNIDMKPSNTNGIARVNISSGEVTFYDLSMLANPTTGHMAVLNDLVFDHSGHIFITDTFGYQVLRFDLVRETAMVWSADAQFCSQCAAVEPHYDGPNGVDYLPSVGGSDGYLLVALGSSSRRILKVNAAKPHVPAVEVMVASVVGQVPLDDMDAILFRGLPAAPNVLYVVGNGVDSLFKLSSDDGWSTAAVSAVFSTQCPHKQPSALASMINGDIVVYCTNGFGNAPYPITILEQ